MIIKMLFNKDLKQNDFKEKVLKLVSINFSKKKKKKIKKSINIQTL